MYFPNNQIELLERQYFSISRAAKVTGLAPSVIRYWGARSARLDALKRLPNNQRRFLAHQVVHILVVRVVTEELGMSLDGAIDLTEDMDVERFLSDKRRSGEAIFTENHLKELIIKQLSIALQRIFSVEGEHGIWEKRIWNSAEVRCHAVVGGLDRPVSG